MDKSTVRLRVANLTDIGRNPARTANEDYFGHFEGDYGHLFLVCDGMGGHVGGEAASRLAVESIHNYFEANYIPGEEAAAIEQAAAFAQNKLLEAVQHDPALTGMGTTLVLLLIREANFWHAHSGDSRLYLSRGGALMQITKDHSEVQEMVDSGVITREQMSSHPRRNFITRTLGHSSFAPEIAGPRVLRQDDVFLLCSDGLTEYLRDSEIILQLEEEPVIACRNLVDLANQRGGADNITVQVVQVQQCTPFSLARELPVHRKKSLVPPVGVVLTILAFLAAVTWYSLSLKDLTSQPKPAPAKKEVSKDSRKTTSKADRKKKKKKVKPDEAARQLAQLEQLIDARLQAKPALAAYQQCFDRMKGQPRQAGKLKFISAPQGKQMVYVLPGKAVYVAFNRLQDKAGYNMKADEIQALIALALVRSGVPNTLDKDNWEEGLFATAGAYIDENTYIRARELYKKFDAENAEILFGSVKRFGKFRNLIRAGDYNLSLDLPKK